MKKFPALTFFALLCALNTSFGQEDASNNYISKRQWMIGGTMSFVTSDGSTAFTLEPMEAYFVGEKLAFGQAISYRREASTNSYSLLPFVRYYFSQKRLAPFVGMGFGVATGSTEFFNANIGVDYFLVKNVALEGNLAYFQFYGSQSSQSGASLTVGLQFFLR